MNYHHINLITCIPSVCRRHRLMVIIFTYTSIFIIKSLVTIELSVAADSSQLDPNANIRSRANHYNSTDPLFGKMHVVRRLYGDDNADVRRELNKLEERIPRFQTGIPGDLDHKVPYENHPYDFELRRQLENSNTTTDTTSAGSFKPMRIVFYTKALDDIRDSSNAARIDWYKNEILPATAEYWSRTLSVVPVSGNLRMSSTELDDYAYCGDSEFTTVPNEHKSEGVANADLLLYVSGSNSNRFCPDRTLAVAVPCNFDQYDRPTAGAINVCLDNIELQSDGTASPAVVEDYTDVTIHEVCHVLGHSSNSYRFYWDPDTGVPRTPRPFETTSVTCVDGQNKSLVMPNENTMVFVEDASNRRYASIVTPKVRTVARNQFDCASLEGGRLENQPTRAESCTGDHWDERLFYPEAMSGVISPTTNILTSLTLALLEDSGWYKANYTNSKMSPWGLGAGCDFVEKDCLTVNTATADDGTSVSTTTVPDFGKGFFCTDEQDKGCAPEHTHKMACTVLDYYFFVPQDLPDAMYQYFPDEPTTGGPRQSDFCPVYGSEYNNLKSDQLDCRDPANAPTFNVYSEVFGIVETNGEYFESKCIPSTAGEGLCYLTACDKAEMALRINVLGKWIKCDYDFQPHTVFVGQGLVRTTIFCPRIAQACPALFCPFNCAGRGVCNYAGTTTQVGNITVTSPKCECFDTSDTTEACSDSLIPDGKFLEDSSGLFDNLEQNFFDPLIKVFVDHPDAWTSASWAWAAGLISVFLILLLCICSSLWPTGSQRKG